MISIDLNGKKYAVDFVRGRPLRTLDKVEKLIETLEANKTPDAEELDAACEWFCGLFKDQFKVNDLYDGYPCDRLMPDIITAYYAVINGTTAVLTDFPIQPKETAK